MATDRIATPWVIRRPVKGRRLVVCRRCGVALGHIARGGALGRVFWSLFEASLDAVEGGEEVEAAEDFRQASHAASSLFGQQFSEDSTAFGIACWWSENPDAQRHICGEIPFYMRPGFWAPEGAALQAGNPKANG